MMREVRARTKPVLPNACYRRVFFVFSTCYGICLRNSICP